MSLQITLPSNTTPKVALRLAENICELYGAETRVPELEEIIATDPNSALCYADNILNGRFELGELAIASDPSIAYSYASRVIKGRFELGEPAIAQLASTAFWYAMDVLDARFELGEPAILKDLESGKHYNTLYMDILSS
jgi:hypothetical protein